jgi:hypothetical protein
MFSAPLLRHPSLFDKSYSKNPEMRTLASIDILAGNS